MSDQIDFDKLSRLDDEDREALETGYATVAGTIQGSPPPASKLRRALDDLDLVDSFVNLSIFALRSQDCEVDTDVAAVLDVAYERITDIRERVSNVLASLEGAA